MDCDIESPASLCDVSDKGKKLYIVNLSAVELRVMRHKLFGLWNTIINVGSGKSDVHSQQSRLSDPTNGLNALV